MRKGGAADSERARKCRSSTIRDIVEDEAAIARFLERGLNAHGYRVVCADDGEGGTRLAVDELVDLVLLAAPPGRPRGAKVHPSPAPPEPSAR